MLLRRITVENVRSFLGREELALDGNLSILIGPNGGGKTNLLDIAVILLRRYLFASMYPAHAPRPEQEDRYEFRHNDMLNNMLLEPHSGSSGKPQLVEVELEITERDRQNMQSMKAQAAALTAKAGKKYYNLNIHRATNWDVSRISAGDRFTYRWTSGGLEGSQGAAAHFREYMNDFEIDSLLRSEFDIAQLSMPMIYLPVTRSVTGFTSRVELAGYNDFEQKRQLDAAISRTASSIVPLAVGRLAQKFRMLLEQDRGNAKLLFKRDPNLAQLTEILTELGYEWDLESTNPLRNAYDVRLKKQGSSFLVGSASSGERELLTYLFAIFALNVRDALIVVDEPELHLHPNWQKSLLRLFERLASSTGNQFLLATHSGTFISPQSIQYVSRVFSHDQQSRVLRLSTQHLPDAKHLLQIVNSQNNERIFFADQVILVEGLSDRIFFEAVLDHFGRSSGYGPTIEVISVGGKGLFEAYGRLLDACKVDYSIVADLDYIEQIGTEEIKNVFVTDGKDIKKDVVDNIKSVDGETLVRQIDVALQSGNWDQAKETWEYIKSRRRCLKSDLSDESQSALKQFIHNKQDEKIFVLSKGSLEAYLPQGHASKDLGKLIGFLGEPDFWSKLDREAQAELQDIASKLLPKFPKPAEKIMPWWKRRGQSAGALP